MQQAKLAADSRAFPVLIYDPTKGERFSERLSLQGNPSVNFRKDTVTTGCMESSSARVDR